MLEAGEAARGGRELGVREKVKLLTWERLSANKEVIHRWQEVCPFVSISTHLAQTPLPLYHN